MPGWALFLLGMVAGAVLLVAVTWGWVWLNRWAGR